MSRLIPLILLWAVFSNAWAGDPPANLKLSQARANLPAVVAYLDIRDAQGSAVGDLRPDQFRTTLGDKTTTLESLIPFENTGEGVAYIFLVDVSKSIKPDFFARIRGALNDWVDALGSADRMAVLSFGETVEQVADFTHDQADLKAKIADLKPADKYTALHKALIQAMQMGQRADAKLPNRRVIVVLSDGLDDLFGGPTRDEVTHQMQADRVPIYAIGLDKPPVTGKNKEGIDALGRFARESGGDYVSSADLPIEQVYAELRTHIKEVVRAQLQCPDCRGDGNIQRLQFTLQAAGLALSDGLDMRVFPPTPPTPSHPGFPPQWLYIGGGVLLLLLIAGVIFIRRRRKNQEVTPEPITVNPPDYEPRPPVYPDDPPPLPGPKPIPPGELTKIRLVELKGPNRGKDYRLEFHGEATLGRGRGCELAIPDDSEISTRHCALINKHGALFVRDLDSTNGTSVNGVPIAADYPLQEGDVLGLGRTELRVLLQGNKP